MPDQISTFVNKIVGLLGDIGVQVGFVVGVIHEFYRMEVQGRKFRWRSFFGHVTPSVLMGWLAAKIGVSADLENCQLIIWVAFMSLNVFVVVAIFSDRQIVKEILCRYFVKKP